MPPGAARVGKAPIIGGIDPGVRHVGVSVLAGHEVRASLVWTLPKGGRAQQCQWLREQVRRLYRSERVEVVGIEAFAWYGRHANLQTTMDQLTGAILSVPGPRQVQLIRAPDWQLAIVGGKPPPRAWSTSAAWKQLVRTRVELALKARGIPWQYHGTDVGGHLFDSLGLSVYLQDRVQWEQRTGSVHAAAGKRRR